MLGSAPQIDVQGHVFHGFPISQIEFALGPYARLGIRFNYNHNMFVFLARFGYKNMKSGDIRVILRQISVITIIY